MAYFLSETMKVKWQEDHIFKELKGKKCQPGIRYSAKQCFKNEKETTTFPDKQKLKGIHY